VQHLIKYQNLRAYIRIDYWKIGHYEERPDRCGTPWRYHAVAPRLQCLQERLEMSAP
jgi:hypothetical protein